MRSGDVVPADNGSYRPVDPGGGDSATSSPCRVISRAAASVTSSTRSVICDGFVVRLVPAHNSVSRLNEYTRVSMRNTVVVVSVGTKGSFHPRPQNHVKCQ